MTLIYSLQKVRILSDAVYIRGGLLDSSVVMFSKDERYDANARPVPEGGA